MATLVSGRLVTDGTGRLFIMPTDDSGEVVPAIHLVDKQGVPTEQLVADIVEVAWSEDDGGYIEVLAGDDSHNARYHQNDLDISGTTGPLFDADGNLVVPGDPHHSEPLPTDAHYDENAPGKVTADTIPDEISSTATSHTEAYT
jgi:hypothetical protein